MPYLPASLTASLVGADLEMMMGILALMIFAIMVYLEVVPGLALTTQGVSRMPEAGRRIAHSILWFQFFAAQVVAVVLMSTSINGEVYNRTLPMLKVTPITKDGV